jgi:hypothetical protein
MIRATAAPCRSPRPQLRRFTWLVCACLGVVALLGETAGAQSPLDPLVYETTLTVPGGAPGDYFGYHVAVDGDTAAISAAGQNRVYVFVRSNGIWVQQDTLEPPAGEDSDPAFGIVALSGDTILVGAPTADINGEGGGAAYVFERTGTTWSGPVILAPSDRENNFRFGQDVALDGSTAIVGAGGVDAAYIFVKSGGSWQERVKLTSGLNQGGFGWTVAVDGDIAVVGAPFEDNGSIKSQGSAYIFRRNGSTWSSSPQRVRGSDTTSNSQFSIGVAIDGDTILIGATRAVYVFTGAGVVEQAKLTSPEASAFGYSVGIRDDRAIVGALFRAPGATYSQGAAYVFERSGTSWAQTDKLTQPPPTPSNDAGYTVAFDGETAVLGSWNAHNSTGAAFVYSATALPPTGPPSAPINLQATVSGSNVGLSWGAPVSGDTPTSYTLVARLTAGGPVVATLPMGAARSFSVNAPNGTFVLSVLASNASGTGPESTSVTVTVPQAAPPPGPASNLVASVTGTTVSFSWSAPASGGAVTNYVLVAGLTPGFSVPYATMALGPTPSVAVPGVPPGTYYVRVLAQNASGFGAASNEVMVTVAGATPPGVPTLHLPVVTGSTVALSWSAGAGEPPTHFTLTASVSPGGAPIVTVPLIGTATSFAGVPSGTYYLQLTASNAAGTSPPAQVTLTVP